MKMQGFINATLPPPPCPQPDPNQPSRVIGSEDCLFLNIYSAEVGSAIIAITTDNIKGILF